MDLIDQKNRRIKVRIEELESKIRSKKGFYIISSDNAVSLSFNVKANIIYLMRAIDQFFS